MGKNIQIKGIDILSLDKKDKFKLEGFELSPIIKDISLKDKVNVIWDAGTSEWLCFKKSTKGLELISISYIPGMICSLNIVERNSAINVQYNLYDRGIDGDNYYSRMHLLTGGRSTIIQYLKRELRG